MSIRHLLSAAAALSMLAACSDYDPGLSESAINYTDEELAVLSEYEQAFKERYGSIDANHTWGFGEKGSESEAATRSINVNRNNWVIRQEGPIYDEDGLPMKDADGQDLRGVQWVVNTAELPEGTEIPGFPSSIDGKYYTEEGIFDDIDAIEAAGIRAVHPIGDVTKDEILQVSQWFRTHQNPVSEDFNYNTIFFQEISQDIDRDENDPDEGAWDADYDELDENGYGGTCTYGMDYLCIKGADYDDWEHINNYNNYSADVDADGNYLGNHIAESDPNSDEQALSSRKIKYWTSNDGSKAIDFGYHGSFDDAIHNAWVVCKVPYQIDGKWYESYYLAFDYEMDKSGKGGGKVYCDGYYSNWIIKLSAGVEIDTPEEEVKESHNWYRIMCEDLGNTDDFDFNDLVFDVYYDGEAPNYQAHIRVQAAGGILPIFLGEDGKGTYEAHQMLGGTPTAQGKYSPINVGAVATAEPYDFILITNSTDPNDIPIYVSGVDASGVRATTLLPSAGGTTISQAPQKICIPGNTTKWLKERVQIEEGYPHFDKWVNKENGAYGYNGATPWNTTDVDNTKLVQVK